MRRAVLITGGALLAILLLSAQSSALSTFQPNVELVVKGVGLAVLGVAAEFFRRLYVKINAALEMLPNIVAALWGTPDPEGKRKGGLVRQAERIEADLQDVKEAVREMGRPDGLRTRRED